MTHTHEVYLHGATWGFRREGRGRDTAMAYACILDVEDVHTFLGWFQHAANQTEAIENKYHWRDMIEREAAEKVIEQEGQ